MEPKDLTPGMVISHKRYGSKLQYESKSFGDCYVFFSTGESYRAISFLSSEDLLKYEEDLPSLENK